ncbi:MAG: heme exporter protein CcmB [Rhodothermales bacterium]|nr:heme exporter protein CcmB [Rhodothermales bacterium]MBO6779626.1 heme exporter protein CcmB [Rhodothermales bacterium]
MRSWLTGTWAVLRKDIELEFRTRYAVNMLLVFVAASLLVVALAVGRGTLRPEMQSGLLWIVVFFSAAVGLGRGFVAEEDGGTTLVLRMHVPGSAVYAGKLLFTYLLLLAVDLVATFGFVILLNMDVAQGVLLGTVLSLGSLGLAGATTLLSAIIARAANRGPLLPVLLFPLLFPLLLTVVSASAAALEGGGGWSGAAGGLRIIVAFSGVVITGAVLLFEYIWED